MRAIRCGIKLVLLLLLAQWCPCSSMPPAPPRRGHQRRSRARAQAEPHSELFKYLVQRWAWGLLTATIVQEIAAHAVSSHTLDGTVQSPSDVVSLANLGSAGRNPQHCHSQLTDMLRLNFSLATTLFMCPMLMLKRRWGARLIEDVKHGMVSPFLMFSWLWENNRAHFGLRFLNGPVASMGEASARLEDFWRGVPDTDPRKQRMATELLKRPDIIHVGQIWRRAVPINLHGDGFPCCRTALRITCN